MNSRSQAKRIAVQKGKPMPKKFQQCPNCGNEVANDTAEAEGLYTCVECGKQGFDCCVPGSHAICFDCEAGQEEG